MPFPPPMPNDVTTSAFPSPVVSRNSRTPPRGPETETSKSPFSSMTMWRDGPIDSATTRAQKPGCNVRPALSGAQTGFRTCGVDPTRNAARAATSRRDIREYPAGRELREYTAFRLTPTARGLVVPSLNTLLLLFQAATLPAFKQEVVRDIATRAQFTQQMVDQIFSYGELGFQETETSQYLVDRLLTNDFFVREGVFKDVNIAGNGLVSVLFNFQGRSAHAAGAPWRGRSALDAVELMDIGWNFRREHLRLQQRSHYVIPNGGDQPNVVPPTASGWYYLRELDYPHIQEMYALADTIAHAAALMTSTTLLPERLPGSAWPGHFNRVVAEDMYENIKQVGLPQWTDADQRLAKALQRELGGPDSGLALKLDTLRPARR